MDMRLDLFNTSNFSRGRPAWIEALWLVIQALFISSWIPGSWHRIALLRVFGAKIGRGVIVKPGVRIKFPWRLCIGNYTWIGERAWIDNLAVITIGNHCCLSQDIYLCTGSHDWSMPSFDLITKPITIADHVWLGARSVVGPGVTVQEGAVLALGSTATQDLKSWSIHQGIPTKAIKIRSVEVAGEKAA